MWSLPPSGPTISVSLRSTAMWMSSSSSLKSNVSVESSSLYLLEPADHLVQLVFAQHTRSVQGARMADRAGDVLRPEPLVEADGGVDPLEERVLGLIEASHQRVEDSEGLERTGAQVRPDHVDEPAVEAITRNVGEDSLDLLTS